MDRLIDAQYRIQHLHDDGSWADLAEDRSRHGPADHDAERMWGKGRIFRCTTCDEAVTVYSGEQGEVPPPR